MNFSIVYPDYLTSLDYLDQHVRSQIEDANSTEKGLRFAKFAQRLIPQTDIGSTFRVPEMNPRLSADGGVDMTADGISSHRVLFIQSKLRVDRADAVDSVLSKFMSYESMRTGDATLFDLLDENRYFMLVTLSPLDRILESYRKQKYASKAFFEQCVSENRLHFVDGLQILQTLRNAYSKLVGTPQELELSFVDTYLQLGEVNIGVVASSELRRLYREFGDALFFENVRDFIGVSDRIDKSGRSTPNLEIIKTVKEQPQRMLARNNGLVFGARHVEPHAEKPNTLLLKEGSIVNGCQTTMCIIEYAEQDCFVVAKVVQTADSWDITKSANYQTSVPDIDLELARYLRPQLVRRAAASFGVQLADTEQSAFQLIDAIYEQRIAYTETRLLYIGLFSRSPNNVFATNYTELITDVIAGLYQLEFPEDSIFEMLFLLQTRAQISLGEAQKLFSNDAYSGTFERLYKDESPSYRSFIAILALCAAVGVNVAERLNHPDDEATRMKAFLTRATEILVNSPDKFAQIHKLAVKLWMQEVMNEEDDNKVKQAMHQASKRLGFTNLYKKLMMEIDLSNALQGNSGS